MAEQPPSHSARFEQPRCVRIAARTARHSFKQLTQELEEGEHARAVVPALRHGAAAQARPRHELHYSGDPQRGRLRGGVDGWSI